MLGCTALWVICRAYLGSTAIPESVGGIYPGAHRSPSMADCGCFEGSSRERSSTEIQEWKELTATVQLAATFHQSSLRAMSRRKIRDIWWPKDMSDRKLQPHSPDQFSDA